MDSILAVSGLRVEGLAFVLVLFVSVRQFGIVGGFFL